MLAQLEAGAEAAAKLAEGRGDDFVYTVIMLIMVGGMIFLFSKYLSSQSERHSVREKEDKDRQEKQDAFWREVTLKNSDQLDSFANSLDRTSRAAELMAVSAERTDQALGSLHRTQIRDRRAIACAIDAIDARGRDDIEQAAQAIRDARHALISDDKP